MPFCGWSVMGGQSWAMAWPFFALWLAFKVAVWALIVSALVIGIRRLRGHCTLTTPTTPLEILRARYARGELTKQDFESMRRDLEA